MSDHSDLNYKFHAPLFSDVLYGAVKRNSRKSNRSNLGWVSYLEYALFDVILNRLSIQDKKAIINSGFSCSIETSVLSYTFACLNRKAFRQKTAREAGVMKYLA